MTSDAELARAAMAASHDARATRRATVAPAAAASLGGVEPHEQAHDGGGAGVHLLPDELLLRVFAHLAQLDSIVVLMVVPGVCRRWRALCGDTPGIHLDLTRLQVEINNPRTIPRALVEGLLRRFRRVTTLKVLGHELDEDGFGVLVAGCPSLEEVEIVDTPRDTFLRNLGASCPVLTSIRCDPDRDGYGFHGTTTLTAAGWAAVATGCPKLSLVEGPEVMTDLSIAAFAKHCKSLTSVGDSLLGDVSLSRASVVALAAGCPQLTAIHVRSCDLGDELILALVEHLPNLTTVAFEDSDTLSDAGVMTLVSCCKKLSDISLCGCQELTFAAVQAVAEHCEKRLSSVTVRAFGYGLSLTDGPIVTLAERCTRLTSVNLGHNRGIADEALVALAEHCPLLERVNADTCCRITDVGLTALARHCSGLTHVNFNQVDELTDASVVELASHCPKLREVGFSSCCALTDASVISLARCCPGIHNVDFFWCPNLTDTAVIELAKGCTNLEWANFMDCDLVTRSGIDVAVEHCKAPFVILSPCIGGFEFRKNFHGRKPEHWVQDS